MKSQGSLVLSGISISLSRTASFLIGLIASVWITRYLGPELYGQYAQMLWLGSTVGMFVIFGFGNGLTRFISETEARSKHSESGGLALLVLGVVTVLGVLSALLLWGYAGQVALLVGLNDQTYVWAAVPSVIFTPLLTVYSTFLGGRQQFSYMAMVGIAGVITSTAVQFLLIAVGASVQALVLANSLSGIIALILFIRSLANQRNRGPLIWPDSLFRRRYFRYSVVMGLVFLTDAIVWQRSEMFFLGRFDLTTQAGFYSLAYTFAGTAMMLIPGSIGALTMPIAAAVWSTQENQDLGNVFQVSLRFTALLAFPIAIIMGLAGPYTITMIYGSEYAAVGKLLGIIVWGSLAGVLAWNGASVLQAGETPKALLVIGLVAGALNIGLDFVLIQRFEAMGAAIANTLTAFCSATAVLLVARYHLDLSLPIAGLMRIFATSLIAWVPAWLIARSMPPTLISTVAVSLIFFSLYCSLAVLARAIRPEELRFFASQLRNSILVGKGSEA